MSSFVEKVSAISKPFPQRANPPLNIENISFIHIGNIIVFDTEEEEIIDPIVEKICRRNSEPCHLNYMKVLPKGFQFLKEIQAEKLSGEEQKFSQREQHHLEDFLVILFIKGMDADYGSGLNAYAAVGGLEWEAFNNAIHKKEPFNLNEYCRPIYATDEIPVYMRLVYGLTYNFGEKSTNISLIKRAAKD